MATLSTIILATCMPKKVCAKPLKGLRAIPGLTNACMAVLSGYDQ